MQKKINCLIIFSLAMFSVLLIYFIYLLKDYRESTDISFYPVKNPNKTYSPHKTWLISYASDGVFIQNQNNLNMSASMYQAFDVVISYQPHHIDPEYFKKHRKILSQPRGVGYWLWKPYIILKTLEMMPENDVLFYADRSAVFREDIYKVLDQAKKHDITLFSGFHNVRRYTKKIVIDKIMNGNESVRDKAQLEGAFLLLRNNFKTREFIKEWQKYCEDLDLLTDVLSENEYPDFIDHRHDQAILTALYYKSPEQYNLYDYKDRIKAVFLTRRNVGQTNCSLLSVTFNKLIGNSSWLQKSKYFVGLRKKLIGCQVSPEPLCSMDKNSAAICENRN
jgi:hypothetical protein